MGKMWCWVPCIFSFDPESFPEVWCGDTRDQRMRKYSTVSDPGWPTSNGTTLTVTEEEKLVTNSTCAVVFPYPTALRTLRRSEALFFYFTHFMGCESIWIGTSRVMGLAPGTEMSPFFSIEMLQFEVSAFALLGCATLGMLLNLSGP